MERRKEELYSCTAEFGEEEEEELDDDDDILEVKGESLE
jgi:hypothetical protein